MTGAIMCLLYYGFQSEEIRVIKRKDVDVDTRTVCGKYIDHDIAWSIICKAKNTTTYLKNHARGQLGKLEMNLGDGPYLIRTSRDSSNDNPSANWILQRPVSKRKENCRGASTNI